MIIVVIQFEHVTQYFTAAIATAVVIGAYLEYCVLRVIENKIPKNSTHRSTTVGERTDRTKSNLYEYVFKTTDMLIHVRRSYKT